MKISGKATLTNNKEGYNRLHKVKPDRFKLLLTQKVCHIFNQFRKVIRNYCSRPTIRIINHWAAASIIKGMIMLSFEHLKPEQFEEFCFDLLNALGFINVDWRKGTGLASSPSDFGRDIECQFSRTDVDDEVYLEKWFVECKHYTKGIPPKALLNALAWAESGNVNVLLIIASNFLSNQAKEYLDKYSRDKAPHFKIKVWEGPDIEKLTADKSLLLRKYDLAREFTFLTAIHPTHALYMKSLPINSLDYMFGILDNINAEERDATLSWITSIIIKNAVSGYHTDVIFGQTITLPEYDRTKLTYEAFKEQCYNISEVLDESLLVFMIISWVLQCQLGISDITSIDEFVQKQEERLADITNGVFRDSFVVTERDRKGAERLKEILQESIDKAPKNIRNHYASYIYFCEKVVAPLLQEKYLLVNAAQPPSEG